MKILLIILTSILIYGCSEQSFIVTSTGIGCSEGMDVLSGLNHDAGLLKKYNISTNDRYRFNSEAKVYVFGQGNDCVYTHSSSPSEVVIPALAKGRDILYSKSNINNTQWGRSFKDDGIIIKRTRFGRYVKSK